jgi:hypothetical protein
MSIEKYRSSLVVDKYGIPHGSIFGPVLFLTYINNLPKALSQKCVLFADDTTFIIKGVDVSC